MVIRERVPWRERLVPSRSMKRVGWVLVLGWGRVSRKEVRADVVVIISGSMVAGFKWLV